MGRTSQTARKCSGGRPLASPAAVRERMAALERERLAAEERRRRSWPFGCEGEPTDVLVPPGKTLPTINTLLEKAEVDAGEFSFGGEADALPALPGLTVEGVGTIQLPFSPEKLLPVCEQAGDKESSTWRLGPERVTFKNPLWAKGMQTLTTTVGNRLGFKGVNLACELQELVVYGEGAVVNKTQNEKKGGVVATLLIQLPSEHEGGALVVYRGRDLEFRHDFGVGNGTAPFMPQYAVYFADAPHSREEVTSGYQLMLEYSLVLPSEMMHLQDAKGDRPLCEELAEVLADIDPKEECFALLLKNSYDEASLRQRGIDALRGVDKARYRALLEASNLVPESKSLVFYIAYLSRVIEYSDCNPSAKRDQNYTGEFADWEEDEQRDTVTWYSPAGKRYVTTYEPDYESEDFNAKFTPAFLNPDRLTLTKVWDKCTSDPYDGDWGGKKRKEEYYRFAVFVWPAKKDAEYRLETISIDACTDALLSTVPVSTESLQGILEKASSTSVITEGNQHNRPGKLRSSSVTFCNAVVGRIVDSCESALVVLFFDKIFASLGDKGAFVDSIVAAIRAFPWSDVGDAILKALSPEEHAGRSHNSASGDRNQDPKLRLALRVIAELDNGEAKQALLDNAVERSVGLTPKALQSTGCLELLWMVVIRCDSLAALTVLVDYFKQTEPSGLSAVISTASKYVADLATEDERFIAIASLAEKRLGWLNQQLCERRPGHREKVMRELAAEKEKLLSERFTAPAANRESPTVGRKRPRAEPETIVIDDD